MDDSASSNGTCSSGSFTQSYTKSSSSTCRPQQTRQQSFTHVFPTNSATSDERLLTHGRDCKTSRAALRELLHPTSASLDSNDRTRLLDSGLQWLLETSTPSHTPSQRGVQAGAPLSQESMNAFNIKDERRTAIQKKSRNGTGSWSESTKTWLDDQNKVNALPPR